MTATSPRDVGRPVREDAIQFAVTLVLDALGVLWAHAPNEALQRGGLLYGATLVGQGVKAGVPDVLIFDTPPAFPDRRGAALELKTLTGSPSPDQRRWLAALAERGWRTSCPRGLGATLAELRACGWDVSAALQKVSDGLGDESGRASWRERV